MTIQWKNVAMLCVWPALAIAGPCEDRFTKSGNVLSGTNYNSSVTVQGLSIPDAIAQLHGIALRNKLDILTEDAANGAMLLEDRMSFKHKAIPYVVSASAEGGAATIGMLVKLNKGAIAKSDDVKTEICSMLSQIQGGDEGRAAAAAGAHAAPSNEPRKVDALVLSLELVRQMQDSAESIPLRYKNRVFTVSGRVQYVIKDGDVYRMAYDIPEPRDRPLKLLNDPGYKIDISCLMAPSQSAWAIALRPGEKVRLTGTYSDFDQFKRVMWLGNCKPE